MQTSTPLEIIQRLYNAFAARDEVAIRALFHPEIVWTQMQGFPNGGAHIGADAIFSNVFDRFREDWTDWKADVRELLVSGDAVIALGAYSGTYIATEKNVTASFAHVYRVERGLVTSFDQYTDTALIANATR